MGWRVILGGLLLSVGGIAHTQPASPLLTAIRSLQVDDARLQTLGWRLGRANAPFCRNTHLAIGLLLFDVRNFGQTNAIRAALGLSGDIGVEAVAKGSPGDIAGLRAGDEIVAIAGQPMTALPPVKAGDFNRLEGLHDRIDRALAAEGSVEIEVKSSGAVRPVTLVGQSVCASRFELLTSGNHAGADGQTVRIGRNILAESPDDAQAAALVGHEFSHNILGHPAWLRIHGRKSSLVRQTETEADRLAVWLIYNAGYNINGAADFMRAWGARHDPALTRSPTHQGYKTRAGIMDAEANYLDAESMIEATELLDWRKKFAPR